MRDARETCDIIVPLNRALWIRLRAEADLLGFAAPEALAAKIIAHHLVRRPKILAAAGTAPLDAMLGIEAASPPPPLPHMAAGPRCAGIDFAKIQERARGTEEPRSSYLARLVKGG